MVFSKEPGNYFAQKMRSLRLKLENKPLPKIFKWLMRFPANNCHGFINFYHLDGNNLFKRPMTLRWANAPEPNPLIVCIDGKKGEIYDPVIINYMQNTTIYPGESAEIDIVVKIDEDFDCYGWNNESYRCSGRNSDFRLPIGRYRVEITILSSGKKFTKKF